MRAPPILPLTAVAIGGVLALNGLYAVDKLPAFIERSKAWAEGAAAPAAAPAKPAQSSGQPPAQPQKPSMPAPGAAGSSAPPVCAPSPAELAKEAGLSPGELQTLQNLSARRGQLDDREKALDMQIQLLGAAEAKVDGKLKALTALKAELKTLLGQADQQSATEIDRLVIVYSKMKPRDAAAIMATLDDKVRIPVAAKMKDKDLSAVLSQMPTSEARKLTESLANRFAPLKAMSQTLSNPPPEQAPAEAPAKPARRARKPAASG